MNGRNDVIPLALFPAYARPKLSVFDADGDGQINAEELMKGCDAFLREKQKGEKLTKMLVVAVSLIFMLAGTLGGMTFAVLLNFKDTGASSGAAAEGGGALSAVGVKGVSDDSTLRCGSMPVTHETFCRSDALLLTTMGWIFIPAHCFALP